MIKRKATGPARNLPSTLGTDTYAVGLRGTIR